MNEQRGLPDPISFLEGLLPGNPFLGELPIPRGILDLMNDDAEFPVPIQERPKEVIKSGCTAAESTILSLGFLDGLAEGMKGFGVLRQGKEYLEQGARAAESLGKTELAREMRSIAADLPNVRTREQAREVAQRLRPLKAEAWELGRQCDRLVVWGTDAIIALAERVAHGEIPLQEAKEILKDAP